MSEFDPQKTAKQHRARASAALEIGRHARAEESARAALSCSPRDVEALIFLARALMAQGRYEEALREAHCAVEFAPADGYAHYILGFVLQISGSPLEAVIALQEAVRLSPWATRYASRLAIALCDLGQRDEARAHIQSVHPEATEDALLADECTRIYASLKDPETAEKFARRGVFLRPDDASTHWRLAWLLSTQRRFDEAAQSARVALGIDPNSWIAWEELGYALLERRSDLGAEAALAEALRLRPTLRTAAHNLVLLYRRQGRLVRAERLCSEVLERDKDNEKLRKTLGEIQIERKRQADERRHRRLSFAAGLLGALLSALTSLSRAGLVLAWVIAGVFLVLCVRAWREREPEDNEPPPRIDWGVIDGLIEDKT
ncbi:MAG: tetratricopeptide repeat protein [Deltaproteobacteria bacterium]|nr:tetratricopeptide repeat protein [Deltaproteobacteria bacterium]